MVKRKKAGRQLIAASVQSKSMAPPKPLLKDVRDLIRHARSTAAYVINTALVLLYWQIGRRIRSEILKNTRGGYGEQIISTLSNKLTAEFGDGFSQPNLSRMTRFAEVFPNRQIISTLSNKLSWSHFIEIISFADPLQRDFYAEMCRIEGWSVRTLRAKVQGMLFERTALSRKPAALARQEIKNLRRDDRMTPDLFFRDPYLLDFLGLSDAYSEKDLESAILRELQNFILEMGTDLAFLARQKRIVIDGKDYRIDLLFYHRRLRRLLAIDLKIGAFEAADKGQMELYLRWLERHEMRPGEARPLGLILCSEKGEEQIELLQLDRSGIQVASYLTDLPPRPLLEKKLHEAVLLARARLKSDGKQNPSQKRIK